MLVLYLICGTVSLTMKNLTTFLLLAALAVVAVGMTSFVNTWMFQEANAARCDRNLVAVCGVCVNANVIGQQVSQRCEQ